MSKIYFPFNVHYFHRNLSSTSNATGAGPVSANGEHEALLSNHKKRHVYFRVSVASLNEQKQVSNKYVIYIIQVLNNSIAPLYLNTPVFI